MKRVVLTILLSTLCCLSAKQQDPLVRLQANLLIGDTKEAIQETKAALEKAPDSRELHAGLIRAYAQAGKARDMLAAWRGHIATWPLDRDDHTLQEEMAWGIIRDSINSPALPVRVYAIISAFLSQDIRGVELLAQAMQDPNSALRSAAVELAGYQRDRLLQEKVVALAERDRSWQVRIEALRAIGRMRIFSARELLSNKIATATSTEERRTAIEAMVNLMEAADPKEISTLAQAERAGLRILACRIVAHLDVDEAIELILPLTDDPHAGVRQAAVGALGLLRVEATDRLLHALGDPDPDTSITAAWALTVQSHEAGLAKLREWITHDNTQARRLASGALAATGQQGLDLCREFVSTAPDAYVRLNLAIGLLGQRQELERVKKELATRLEEKPRLMVQSSWPFEMVLPSKVRHHPYIPRYPETVDQSVRLYLLNLMATFDPQQAQNQLKAFLTSNSWGITGVAAVTLLQEGDALASDMVRGLLTDSDPMVRVQAALTLALWMRDPTAIQVLEEAYATADRRLREKILEGLGRAGVRSSSAFLTERLTEPYPSLRTIAASSLLQCLYQ